MTSFNKLSSSALSAVCAFVVSAIFVGASIIPADAVTAGSMFV